MCISVCSSPVGILLLCEVALGTPRELLSSDYNAGKLPKNHHRYNHSFSILCTIFKNMVLSLFFFSTKGCGKTAPDPAGNLTLPDGVVVPAGKSADTGVTNPKGYTLLYDELIVYDISQV